MLWSRAAVDSTCHRNEYKLARSIEFRRFHNKLVHIFLQDLSDVTDDDVKTLKPLKFMADASGSEKRKALEQILNKVLGRVVKR